MKTPVVITLLILGTLLILAPFVFDYLSPVTMAQYPLEIERYRVRDYRMTYATVSWVAGAGMVLVSIVSSVRSGRRVDTGREESVTAIRT